MEKEELNNLSDEELLIEKKKLKKSKVYHALVIGFLGGIVVFGLVSWFLSSKRLSGLLLPMVIPIALIYKLVKSPNKHTALEEVLKERNVN